MRASCLICTGKHLGKAESLLCEVFNGYPHHIWRVIGNMSEAEDESVQLFPELSRKIRAHRIALQEQYFSPEPHQLVVPFDELFTDLLSLTNGDDLITHSQPMEPQ
jgi:hypothetical protein